MLKKTAEISAVLRDLIQSVSFKTKYRKSVNCFIRKGKLGFTKMVNMIIKKSNKSSQNSLNDSLKDISAIDSDENYTVTNSAYTQARAKLDYTAFQKLSSTTVELFYADGEFNEYKGFRLCAIDGSIVILPSSDDVKKEFKPTIAKCQIEEFSKEVVQSRVSCLYDVLNNISIDASINDKSYGERTLALEHLEHCNKDDLIIFDRGYPSYELFAKYNQKTNFLMRIKKNSFAKAKFLFAPHSEKKDVVLEINAPKHLKDELRRLNLPTKMKIRFVQVILDNGTVEVLATNVLDNNILQTSDFKELYALRWGIETYYDILKNRLSLENFTGLTALAVKQDFYATIFLTNYEALLVYDANLELQESTKDNKHRQKINKAISFNTIKHRVFDLFYSDKPLDIILQEMEKLFLTNRIIIRPNRKSNPRLDKDKQKSTIATNTINHIKRKKKNVGD